MEAICVKMHLYILALNYTKDTLNILLYIHFRHTIVNISLLVPVYSTLLFPLTHIDI